MAGHKPEVTMTDTKTDSEVQAPKIEFPCEGYPIKVIGDAGEGFADMVLDIVRRHAPDLDVTTLTLRDSSNGRFVSVQVAIRATGVEQLQALHVELRATGRVHVVL
jgi:putative lipoic acid-binding regulatory protein